MCFKLLQSQLAIVQNPCKLWQIDTMYEIIIACVIMHNIIIDKRDSNCLSTSHFPIVFSSF